LNNPVELVPKEFALLSPLGRLDFILGLLRESKPEFLTSYVEMLTSRYETLSPEDEVSRRGIAIESEISDKEHLKDYPSLAKWNLNYFLSELGLDIDASWDDKLEVPGRNHLRSFLMPKYQNLLALIDVIGCTDAIDFIKKYIQLFMEHHLRDSEDEFDSLEEWAKKGREDDEGQGWVRIWGEVKDGTVIIRKDTCGWDAALEDIDDRELKYLVCCYGDFFSIKGQNRNYALTMEHTIAKGDPYCDVVIHDLRVNDKLEHPPKEFFDNLLVDEE
jgi:hypothetical protein